MKSLKNYFHKFHGTGVVQRGNNWNSVQGKNFDISLRLIFKDSVGSLPVGSPGSENGGVKRERNK